MATVLGAGEYICGENIPSGRYNLIAKSGTGMLTIEKRSERGKRQEEVQMSFGVWKYDAKTYYGLVLTSGISFKVSGSVVFEISKAEMINID